MEADKKLISAGQLQAEPPLGLCRDYGACAAGRERGDVASGQSTGWGREEGGKRLECETSGSHTDWWRPQHMPMACTALFAGPPKAQGPGAVSLIRSPPKEQLWLQGPGKVQLKSCSELKLIKPTLGKSPNFP